MNTLTEGSGTLAGKRALVVGGASGIGAAIAARFAREGASAMVADVAGSPDIALDVRDEVQVKECVEAALSNLGGLDTLVYAAGRPVVAAASEVSTADWDDGFAINARGPMLLARAAWDALRESSGSVVAIASAVGLRPTAGQAAYCASKAACVMLVRCLAIEGAPYGIRANSICPGFIETPMFSRFLAEQAEPEEVRERLTAAHPLGRLGVPDDIAAAAAYLASDDAAWITGTEQIVDGGISVGLGDG